MGASHHGQERRQSTPFSLHVSTQQACLHTVGLAMQKKYGTLRADTITRDKLKGPDHGANVSDLEARINDGKGDIHPTSS